jgi:hypothetical protein
MMNEPTIAAPTAAKIFLLSLLLAVCAAERMGGNQSLTIVNAICGSMESREIKITNRILEIVSGKVRAEFRAATARLIGILFSSAMAVSWALLGTNDASAQTLAAANKTKIVETYMRAAFAASEKLIKFESSLTIAHQCSAKDCAEILESFRNFFSSELTVFPEGKMLDKAEIVLIFRKEPILVEERNGVFTNASGRRLYRNIDPRCGVVGVSEKFEVKKIIINILDAEPREAKLFCIMFGLMQGSGLAASQTYQQYSSEIQGQSADQNHTALLGLSRLLILHLNGKTRPGDEQVATEKAVSELLGTN